MLHERGTPKPESFASIVVKSFAPATVVNYRCRQRNRGISSTRACLKHDYSPTLHGGQLAGDHLDDHRGRGDLDEGCGGIDEARGDLDEGCDFENDLDEGCHFENANFLEHGDHHYLKSNLWPIYQDCCDD